MSENTIVRKERMIFSAKQKLEYAKLMVEEGYTNKQICELSGAGDTAVSRWKRQYREELKGIIPKGKTALTEDNRRIQELERELAESKRDNELLKKATAFFIRDNPALK